MIPIHLLGLDSKMTGTEARRRSGSGSAHSSPARPPNGTAPMVSTGSSGNLRRPGRAAGSVQHSGSAHSLKAVESTHSARKHTAPGSVVVEVNCVDNHGRPSAPGNKFVPNGAHSQHGSQRFGRLASQTSGSQPAGFATFRDNLHTGMDFLKRRFSTSESAAAEAHMEPAGPEMTGVPSSQSQSSAVQPPPAGYAAAAHLQQHSDGTVTAVGNDVAARAAQPQQSMSHGQQQSEQGQQQQQSLTSKFSLASLTNRVSSAMHVSAPTSPQKTAVGQSTEEGDVGMVQHVSGFTRNLFNAATGQRIGEKTKVILVIERDFVDWSKYGRGRKVHNGEFDVRIEQADFSELSLHCAHGRCAVEIAPKAGAARNARSFSPDLVLVRQTVKSETWNYSRTIIGLHYAGVAGVNALPAVHAFSDKPWVYAHLLGLQRRLGRETFPLIEQNYYPNASMLKSAECYPVVVKVGRGHGGIGKMKVGGPSELCDAASLVALANDDCTVEPFIDAKYDIQVQKIGKHYKAFMRKGISGHWKSNMGSAVLEQIPMTDRYRLWVDEAATLFGGLEVCCVCALVAPDGSEHIYEVNDSTMNLLGETQEEDRKHMAEVAIERLNKHINALMSRSQSSATPARPAVPPPPAIVNNATPSAGPSAAVGSPGIAGSVPTTGRAPPARPVRQPSLPPSAAPPSQAASGGAAATSPQQQTNGAVEGNLPSAEDTMGNLKKTFAGCGTAPGNLQKGVDSEKDSNIL